MTINEFWDAEFRGKSEARDFAGRLIRKSEYVGNSEQSPQGWNHEHIRPLAEGGANSPENIQISHWRTNEEKANKSSFSANGKEFKVKRTENLTPADKMANYPYKRRKKEYCIVIISR